MNGQGGSRALAKVLSKCYIDSMSAGKFKVTYSAAAQLASLAPAEKVALKQLFSNNDFEQPPTTKRIDDGRFVSRLGSKRVLWSRSTPGSMPEILSIVDDSFAQA
jgi:hypothetical protein